MTAVITGDIAGYTRLGIDDRERLILSLKEFFVSLSSDLNDFDIRFEIIRGDSFQGRTSAKDGFRTALMIKCFLNTLSSVHEGVMRRPLSIRAARDARIAIGFGNVDFHTDRISESDGEAFWYSGRLLDEMKSKKQFIKVMSRSQEFNEEMDVHCLLLEAVMSKWSIPQAEVVLEKLKGKKDYEIADSLDTTRQAMSSRARNAGWHAIESLLERVDYLIKSKELF